MPNPTTAPSSTTSAAATFVEGITDSLPIVIGYLPVAFAFGLSAVKLGFYPAGKHFLFLHYLCWCQPICDYRPAERRDVIVGIGTDGDGNGCAPYFVWPGT